LYHHGLYSMQSQYHCYDDKHLHHAWRVLMSQYHSYHVEDLHHAGNVPVNDQLSVVVVVVFVVVVVVVVGCAIYRVFFALLEIKKKN
jgi:hypothetical protein